MKPSSTVRIPVQEDCQCGSFTLGWRKYPVRITHLNIEFFTAQIEQKIAKKFKVSKFGILRFQDAEWRVEIMSKWVRQDGYIELELKQLEELVTQRVDRASLLARNRSQKLITSDPLLPLAVFMAVFTAFLILPGLGGRWGTSSFIVQWAENCFQAVRKLLRT